MRNTYVETNLNAYYSNLKAIRDFVNPAKVMAVLKANAYGHGLLKMAETAVEADVDYLGVSIPEEGIRIRNSGIKLPILVFTPPLKEQLALFVEYNLELTLCSFNIAQQTSDLGKATGHPVSVHVKIDTGMGRLGVYYKETNDFLKRIDSFNGIKIKGIYSHFATSDQVDKNFAFKQLEKFDNTIKELGSEGFDIPIKHIANSGAILYIPDSNYDMVRPGILSYGLYPSERINGKISVEPVMSLKSKIIYTKSVPAGTGISYGRTFFTSEKTRIATIPIGYADGYNRQLSNKGEVIINGSRFPVVGIVCMDHIMVDLLNDQKIKTGDEVVIYSTKQNEINTISRVAEMLNTIPYEICCWISDRVPRVYNNRKERD